MYLALDLNQFINLTLQSLPLKYNFLDEKIIAYGQKFKTWVGVRE